MIIFFKQDQRIFCMFDRRRHVTKPIREELFKRGWEELQPEKGTVLRKNRSSPSKIASTSTAIGKDTVVQNPAGIDRELINNRIFLIIRSLLRNRKGDISALRE